MIWFKDVNRRLLLLFAVFLFSLVAAPAALAAQPYDTFDTALMDADKWWRLEFVREVDDADQVLISTVRSVDRNMKNQAHLANAGGSNIFGVDTRIVSISTSPGAQTKARIDSVIYNLNTIAPTDPPTQLGDIWVALCIGDQDGDGNLEAWYEVLESTNDDFTEYNFMPGDTISVTGGISIDTAYRMEIEHEAGTFNIDFRIYNAADVLIGSAVFNPGLPAPPAGPDAPRATISPTKAVTTCAFSDFGPPSREALIEVEFDDVYNGAGLLDDFSGDGLNPAIWNVTEHVREIDTDDDRLLLAVNGEGRQDTTATLKAITGYLEAIIRIDGSSWASGTDNNVRARLEGRFFNDTYGPDAPYSPTETYNGYQGEIWTQMGLRLRYDGRLQAFCHAERYPDADESVTPVELFWHTFPMTIEADHDYLLAIEKTDTAMVYLLVDVEAFPYEVQTYEMSLATPGHPPFAGYMGLRTRNQGTNNGSGEILAYFDDIVTEPRGEINGAIDAPATGDIIVGLFTPDQFPDLDAADANQMTLADGAGNYSFHPVEGAWVVAAFQDLNGNTMRDDGEPAGIYTLPANPQEPETLDLAPGQILDNIDFELVVRPVIVDVDLERHHIEAGMPAPLPSGRSIFVEVDVMPFGGTVHTVELIGENVVSSALSFAGNPDGQPDVDRYTGWALTDDAAEPDISAGPYDVLVTMQSGVAEIEEDLYLAGTTLDLPVLVSPSIGVTAQPATFVWEAVAGADHYTLFIYTDDVLSPVLQHQDIAATSYSLAAAELALVQDETYFWTVIAKDANEFSVSIAAPFSFVFDAQVPVTSISPVPGFYDEPVTVALTADTAATIHLDVNGSPLVGPSPLSVLLSADDTYTLTYHAEDGAGNEETPRTATYVVDTHAPDVDVNPQPGTYGSAQSVTIDALDMTDVTIYAQLLTSDPGPSPAMPIETYGSAISLPVSGDVITYYLVYGGVDQAGNVDGPNVAVYTIDTRVPVTNLSFLGTPNQFGDDYYHNVNLSGNLSSPDNEIYYLMFFNPPDVGSLPDPDLGSPVAEENLPLSFLAEPGTVHYVVKYFAHNATTGLSEAVRTLSVYIDTALPAPPVVTSAPVATNDNTPTISGTKEANTSLQLVGGGTVVAMNASTSWTYTPSAPLADGIHDLAFTATDRAGNESASTGITIVIDTQAPVLTNPMPVCASIDQALNQSISVMINDTNSMVDPDTIAMTVNGVVYTAGSGLEVAPGPVGVYVEYAPGSLYSEMTTITWSVSAADLVGNPLAANTCTFTTGASVAVSPAVVGLAVGDTYTLTGTGGSLPYGWILRNQAGDVITGDGGDTFEVGAGLTVGIYTLTLTDAADDTAAATIDVIEPINIGALPLHSGATYTFEANGGKVDGQVVWSASAGTIDAQTGDFTAPTVTGDPITVTITAHDATYNAGHATPVFTSVDVTVYPAMEIANAPETTPVVPSGTTMDTPFEAAGGSGNYDWSVTAPNGDRTRPVEADTFTFEAPETGPFAGIYTITLRDVENNDFTVDYQVYVPMRTDVMDNYIPENIPSMPMVLLGAPEGASVITRILDASGADVTDTPGYGTLIDGPVADPGVIFFEYVPEDVDAITEVRFSFSIDDPAWTGTPIETATTETCWVVPIVDVSGTVVDADTGSPIELAVVTAQHDPFITATTDAAGTFDFGELPDDGTTYSFYVAAEGYITKLVPLAQIIADPVITMDPLSAGSGHIFGTVILPGGPSEIATVRLLTADGAYVQDSSGAIIEVAPASIDSSFHLIVPEAQMGLGPYALVVDADGYVAATVADVDPAEAPPAQVDVTLNPVTRIFVSAAPVEDDDPADGYDRVVVTITAQAGMDTFDESAGEIAVLNAAGESVTLVYVAGEYIYTHPAYENFSLTIQADVSESPRDVAADYAATKTWEYVMSATDPDEGNVPASGIFSDGVESMSGNTRVILGPGGVTAPAGSFLTISIVEADPSQAGATGLSGPGIAAVALLDSEGNPVPNEDINELLITMAFDPAVIQPDQLRTVPGFAIYFADTMADLVAGNYAGRIPVGQIVDIDYANGLITFRVDHLTAFGVGPYDGETSSGGGGGGGGGCFIDAAGSQSALPVGLFLGMGLLVLGLTARFKP